MMSFKSRIFGRSMLAVIGLLALTFIGGGVIGSLEASGALVDAEAARFWLVFIFAGVVMVGAMAGGAVWMLSIDEAAQEAHKSAWYWGGSAGMAVGGVLMVIAMVEPVAATIDLPALMGRTDPVAYAAAGAFAMLTLMLIGYGVVWTWWWLSRSRG